MYSAHAHASLAGVKKTNMYPNKGNPYLNETEINDLKTSYVEGFEFLKEHVEQLLTKAYAWGQAGEEKTQP